jgi:PAS domain S-box-containing protein
MITSEARPRKHWNGSLRPEVMAQAPLLGYALCSLPMDTPLVLLVDDDRDTRDLYELVLDMSGYRHEHAESVEGAVDTARRVGPDVILTDWMLGDGDGLALCEALHRYGRTRRIPIVAATGMSLSAETRARARQLGCEVFLTKPVDIDALVRGISGTLQVKQARSLRAAAVRLRRYARQVRESARSTSTGTIASQLLAASRARVSKSVALVLADDAGRYLAVNDRAVELTGYESHELTTMSVADLTPRDGEVTRLWSSFIDAGTQEGVYLVKRRDGLAIPMRYVAVANIAPGLHLSALAPTDDSTPLSS